ncbi:carbohydrate-binding protein [Pontiellaceae bacterium B12219]|nr:carbohydrate-binding protein [Pontiellaceae bacterium B12219]
MHSFTKSIFFALGLLSASPALAQVAYVNCDEFYATSFENLSIDPYWECTFKRPAYINAVNLDGNRAAKVWWTAEGYDGSRLDRGMEACSGNSTSELRFTEDGWYGLRIRFPSDAYPSDDYPAEPNLNDASYPTDKNCIVLQMFAHGRGGSWAGTLIVNDNRLSIEHRDWLTSNITVYELDADIERDTWIPIIIHFKPSTDPTLGKIQVWYDGAPQSAPSYDYTGKFAYDGIDDGNGGWDDGWVDADTMISGIGLKWGMYCADSSNYTPNETRTIYYDDVSQLKGNPIGAWDLVNPEAIGRDAFSRIDAEYYSDQSGVVTTNCADTGGGFQLVDLQNSDWVAFYDVNFGTGANGFQARIASANTGGNIEVRLDGPTGTLLGTCPVSNTGSANSWITETVAMENISGLHDVYLKFTGGSGDLLSLNWFRAVKSTPDLYFSNVLIDETVVARDFHENLPTSGNGVWSYTNDYALAQDGTTNTVLQGGAVVSYAATDDNTARSYLATDFSQYANQSWTAHIAVETANSSVNNTIFFGLGKGLQSGPDNEPTDGDQIYVSWQSGNSGSKVSVTRNGSTVDNTGVWQGDPGYDIYMTYNHVEKTIFFEIDNWAGGRFSGIDVTTATVSTDGYLNDTNNMSIFFGGNGTMTFSDFEVYPPPPPAPPRGVYSAMFVPLQITLGWDAVSHADAYNIFRSTTSGSGYAKIAANVTATSYIDTAIAANETYYYAITSTNAGGESARSAQVQMTAAPYSIIGPDSSYTTAVGQKDNLFDGDVDTFYDTTVNNSWVGLDFGAGNAKQIFGASYTLRDWTYSIDRTIGAEIQGANTADFSDAVTLYTVPSDVLGWASPNEATISDTNTYRYVRMLAPAGRPLYGLSELSISTDPGIPAAPQNLYAWPDSNNVVTVRWDADPWATSGFNVYRSTNGTDYFKIASHIMVNEYVDTNVSTGVTYHYKASGVNSNGEGGVSASEFAVPTPYFIIGSDATDVLESKYELFDGDTDTIFDRNASGNAGLDFGAGNAQQLESFRYFYRNDSWGNTADNGTTRSINRSVGFRLEGANSEDFSDAMTLYTLTSNGVMSAWNEIMITNTAAFRYIRLQSAGSPNRMYTMADLEFVSTGVTPNGTPISWLAQYGLNAADDDRDSDADGLLTWEEYVAGTVPTDSGSVLKVNSAGAVGSDFILTWQSIAGKNYSIITNASLTSPTPGISASGITGQETETSYTTTVNQADGMFYQIGVE